MTSGSRDYNPRDFLGFANALISDQTYDEKTRHRTVVGRAYYAAFLLVQKRLEELGYTFEGIEHRHKDVIECVMEQNSSFGNKLENLRSYRIDSDYIMQADVNENVAKRCLVISNELVRSVGQLHP